LIGFADGSVASSQPGKDKALVRLGALDAAVNGLAALDKSSVAASTTTEVAILKKGAIATRVKSEHGPCTALTRGVTRGGLAYGTATGAVVCLKADGALARKHQIEVPQDCALWFLHRDPRGHLRGRGCRRTIRRGPDEDVSKAAHAPALLALWRGPARIGGPLSDDGSDDVFLVKLAPSGTHVWSQRFGDFQDQSGLGVAGSATGRVGVTGRFPGGINLGDGPKTSRGQSDLLVGVFGP
jgi:hypothetical protein